jgi:Ran GTPase-activating protein (RanGAP) involved in mRNA processing and transport
MTRFFQSNPVLMGNIISILNRSLSIDEMHQIADRRGQFSLLRLDNLQLGDTGGAGLLRSLRGSTVLNELYVPQNQLGLESARAIKDLLETTTTLKNLDLQYNNFGNLEAALIFEGLRHNSSVEKFSLWLNQIDDQGARVIAEYLASDPSLSSLSLGNNPITINGLQELERAIRDNTHLLEFTGPFRQDDADKKTYQALLQRIKSTLSRNRQMKKESLTHLLINNPLLSQQDLVSFAYTLKDLVHVFKLIRDSLERGRRQLHDIIDQLERYSASGQYREAQAYLQQTVLSSQSVSITQEELSDFLRVI